MQALARRHACIAHRAAAWLAPAAPGCRPGGIATLGARVLRCRARAPAEESALSTAVADPLVPPVAPANPASRTFAFNEEQLNVITHLRSSISSCAMAFTATFATNVFLSCAQAFGIADLTEAAHETTPTVGFGNFTVGDVAYWADSAMLVVLLLFALGPLDAVLSSKTNQMRKMFSGLDRMGLIFQQLSIGSLAVGTVTALEAAVKYPPLVLFFSEVFFGLAVARAAAMWYVLSRQSSQYDEIGETLGAVRGCTDVAKTLDPLERIAVTLAFGYLVQHDESPLHQPPPEDGQPHYEFIPSEERILNNLTDSVNTAGLAIGLQAFATLMLTVADFGNEDWSGVVSNGINASNKLLCATLVFQASQSFDRALHTVGSDDVKHLMDGLGEEGLTNLFDKLSVLAWAVSLAAFLSVAAPWLEENYVLTAVGDAASHSTAELVIEVIEHGIQILRGL